MNAIIITADTIYEPWTDGHAVGFKVTRIHDGAIGYIYLNPSVNESGGPDDTPAVFIYQGGHGDPSIDSAENWYAIGDHTFTQG